LFFVLTLLFVITEAHPKSPRAETRPKSHSHPKDQDQPSGEIGQFQIYQLAQSWTTEFCSGHKNFEECATESDWARSHLALHGLWPGYDDVHGVSKPQWPQFCDCPSQQTCVGDVDPSELGDEIIENLTKYGPGYVTDKYKMASHEWKKHGRCTGFLTPSDYFTAALSAILTLQFPDGGEDGTPSIIRENVGGTVALQDLLAAYPTTITVSCDKKCQLSQVITCWAANPPDPSVGGPIDCPRWSHSSCSKCDSIAISDLQTSSSPNDDEQASSSPNHEDL